MSNAEYNESQYETGLAELRERYEVEAETQAARLQKAWDRIAYLEEAVRVRDGIACGFGGCDYCDTVSGDDHGECHVKDCPTQTHPVEGKDV